MIRFSACHVTSTIVVINITYCHVTHHCHQLHHRLKAVTLGCHSLIKQLSASWLRVGESNLSSEASRGFYKENRHSTLYSFKRKTYALLPMEIDWFPSSSGKLTGFLLLHIDF